jgi:hypothetical protein
MGDHVVCERPVARTVPEPSSTPLPSYCHGHVGHDGHVLCERPVARAAPEFSLPSPTASPTPLASMSEMVSQILPFSKLNPIVLDPIIVEELLLPAASHTHVAVHSDEKFVEVVPVHSSSPSPTPSPTPFASMSEMVSQMLSFSKMNPVVVEEPIPPAAEHKHTAVHGEEDFIEVVPTTEYTGLREKSTKTKEEVADRDLGDCKSGSWGC